MVNFKHSNVNPKRFSIDQVKIYLIILPLAAFMILPIIFIVNHAFKPMNELFAFPPRFFVIQPTIDNFQELARFTLTSRVPIGRYVFNSLLIVIAVVVSTVLISSMAGFAFSKIPFRGKKELFEIDRKSVV